MNESIDTSEREGVVPGEETLKQRVRFAINNPDVLHTPDMFRKLLIEQQRVNERAVAALLGAEKVVLVRLASIQQLSEALGHPDVVTVANGESPEDGLIRMAVSRLNFQRKKQAALEPGLPLESGEFVSAAELNRHVHNVISARTRCPICLGIGQFNTLIDEGRSTTPCSACNGEGMVLG